MSTSNQIANDTIRCWVVSVFQAGHARVMGFGVDSCVVQAVVDVVAEVGAVFHVPIFGLSNVTEAKLCTQYGRCLSYTIHRLVATIKYPSIAPPSADPSTPSWASIAWSWMKDRAVSASVSAACFLTAGWLVWRWRSRKQR